MRTPHAHRSAPHAHRTRTARALHAHCTRTACTQQAHCTRTARAPHAHTACTLHGPSWQAKEPISFKFNLLDVAVFGGCVGLSVAYALTKAWYLNNAMGCAFSVQVRKAGGVRREV